MELRDSFTKVTPFSKTIALILFISLPFIGFFLGIKYQKSIMPETQTITIVKNPEKPIAEEKFCGGIAGIQCDDGYKCKFYGSYPDAGGKCIKDGN